MKQTTYQLARKLYLEDKFEEAYNLYEQGTLENDPKCYYGIAIFHYMGHYVKQDAEKGLEILKEHFDDILYFICTN